jgi:hypothetical protein
MVAASSGVTRRLAAEHFAHQSGTSNAGLLIIQVHSVAVVISIFRFFFTSPPKNHGDSKILDKSMLWFWGGLEALKKIGYRSISGVGGPGNPSCSITRSLALFFTGCRRS